MKKVLSGIMGVTLISLLLVTATGQKALAQDVTVSYQSFYDELSPYGQWVYDPQFGNVWVPYEEGDFRPYGTRGHWVMTDYGNTWVSEDPWGWACYHYGRWTYDPYYGWVWIPGYEWAPAWVSWRYGGGYCGWAPLGPGVTVSMGYNCPESWWVFVAPTYMYERDCYHHWRGPSYNNTYIRQTTVINNYYVDNSTRVRYNYGPRQDVIQRDTHQPVQVYRVSQTSRPGAPSVSGNRVSLYRPAVNRSTMNTARPANVVQAPRAISNRPQPQTTITPNRQPEFRQQMQRQEPNRNNQQNTNRQEPGRNNPNVNRQEPQQRVQDQRNQQQQRVQEQRVQDQRNQQQQRVQEQRVQDQRNQQQQRVQEQRVQDQRNQQQQRVQEQRVQDQRNQQQQQQQQRMQEQRVQEQRNQQQQQQQQRMQEQRNQQQQQQQRMQQQQHQEYRPQPQQQRQQAPPPQQRQQAPPPPRQQAPPPQQHQAQPQREEHGGGRR